MNENVLLTKISWSKYKKEKNKIAYSTSFRLCPFNEHLAWELRGEKKLCQLAKFSDDLVWAMVGQELNLVLLWMVDTLYLLVLMAPSVFAFLNCLITCPQWMSFSIFFSWILETSVKWYVGFCFCLRL